MRKELYLVPVNAMHSGAMAMFQLNSHEPHQLLLMYRESYNMLGADSFACQNVCHTQDVEVFCWALRVVHCNHHWRVLAAAEGKAQLNITVSATVYL